MLTLLATPIGNLKDISQRAIEALSTAEIIACEDTRVTEKLCHTLEIRGALIRPNRPRYISYHKHNEIEKANYLIELLQQGMQILLISDAGTPAISDPGHKLVEACHIHHIPVTIIPGPCAFVAAIALSGFHATRMQFVGFLPKPLHDRKVFLRECLEYQGISCAYETHERIEETIDILVELEPERPIALIRELTKKFEEILITTPTALQKRLKNASDSEPLKGEITLTLHPPGKEAISSEKTSDWYINEVHLIKKKQNISLSEACQLIARAHGIKKGWLYNLIINSQKSNEESTQHP
ncbi:MAG: 16S rRNA (cytidine(1402)-2'-O)-methyltransferase [Chlamydia sp.]